MLLIHVLHQRLGGPQEISRLCLEPEVTLVTGLACRRYFKKRVDPFFKNIEISLKLDSKLIQNEYICWPGRFPGNSQNEKMEPAPTSNDHSAPSNPKVFSADAGSLGGPGNPLGTSRSLYNDS